jgi:hypothetical protein
MQSFCQFVSEATKVSTDAPSIIAAMKQKYKATRVPAETRFLLPDGTRLTFSLSVSHEHAAQAAGYTIDEVLAAGILRYFAHFGIQLTNGTMTAAQAQIVADDWIYYRHDLDVDVQAINGHMLGSKEFDSEHLQPAAIRGWANRTQYPAFHEETLREMPEPFVQLKKILPPLGRPEGFGFILPDGTALGLGGYNQHERAVETVGMNLGQALKAGIARYVGTVGITVSAPLTNAQARVIEDNFRNEPLAIDVMDPSKGRVTTSKTFQRHSVQAIQMFVSHALDVMTGVITESYGRFSHTLDDSIKPLHTMTWDEFNHPPAYPTGVPLYAHVTDVYALPDILKHGLLLSKSKGRQNHEPTVIWATKYGDVWGSKSMFTEQRLVVFSVPDAELSGSGIYQIHHDVPPSAIVAIEQAGFSSVSSGTQTVREERTSEYADQYFDAYRKDAGLHEDVRLSLDRATPGHVYRGITEEEADSIRRTGRIQSTLKYSHGSEGTSFATDFNTAESYINYGRDNPATTGKRTYVLEVERTATMHVDHDGYVKSSAPVSSTNITHVWIFHPDGTVTERDALVKEAYTIKYVPDDSLDIDIDAAAVYRRRTKEVLIRNKYKNNKFLHDHEIGHALMHDVQPYDWIGRFQQNPEAWDEFLSTSTAKSYQMRQHIADKNDPLEYDWIEAGADLHMEYKAGRFSDKPELVKVLLDVIKMNEDVQHTIDARLHRISGSVDDRRVTDDVPNMSSISASLYHYDILDDIRAVPMSDFEDQKQPSFYSTTEADRVKKLAADINRNKWIDPLIVVYDKDHTSPYVLEGGHRFDALKLLHATTVPALVVIDLDESINESASPRLDRVQQSLRDACFILDVLPGDVKYRVVEVPVNQIATRERGKRYPNDGLTAAYENNPAGPPPIAIQERGGSKRYTVLDGHHRLMSAKAAGLDTIWSLVVDDVTKDESHSLCATPGCGHWKTMHNGSFQYGWEDCTETGCKCQQFTVK